MMKIMLHEGYKPRFNNPKKYHVILGNHVIRFFGYQHTCMLRAYPSMEDVWSTWELLHHISTCAENMPMNAFQDMHRCLHFADNWEEDRDAD